MKPGHRPWTEAEVATLVAMSRTVSSVTSKAGNYLTEINREPAPTMAPTGFRPNATRAEMVTASLMGDPRVGRSALEQRGGA
jgi:hypothetical protein